MATDPRRHIAAIAALGFAYFIAAAGTISATRYDGGGAFVWVATAILTARLTTTRRAEWPAAVGVCALASMVCTVTVGLGPHVAVPLAIANTGEAVIGALVLRHTVGRRAILDSHRWLMGFVLATGMIGPAFGALIAAGTTTVLLGKPFLSNALHWYAGHALGTLAFMPIAMMILRGDALRLIRSARRRTLLEMTALLLLVAGITTATFAQTHLPLLFLPLLPVILATFRGGPLSTAASIVIVSVIGAIFTLKGSGPIAMVDGPIGERMQFLQFYIAATMLTVLPANAELERRAELFRSLRESEARYRLVTESSTDIVLTVDLRGLLRFVSGSVKQFGGRQPETLIGQPATALVHPDDAVRVTERLRSIMTRPHDVARDEFLVRVTREDARWFETQSRAVLDDDGIVTGAVIALRDITGRKAHEARLARAALTDPLTVANRGAFHEELRKRCSAGDAGCVAMFDLDHFKRINDRYGHAAGDEVLRRFAAIARASVRDQDIVGRLGGEEFAFILPDATLEQARLVCERLRAAIGAERFRFGERAIAVTVSGGVARYGFGMCGDDVLHTADMALYRAKEAGRDRLALAA